MGRGQQQPPFETLWRPATRRSGTPPRQTVLVGGERSWKATIGEIARLPDGEYRAGCAIEDDPRRGVYAVRMTVGTERFGGMMNIGVRPSVTPNGGEIIEVHLFDASRDFVRGGSGSGADRMASCGKEVRLP